jgi:hypothetical protein
MPTKPKSPFPLFNEYSVPELADRLGYALRYLLDLNDGLKPVRPRFRRFASKVLGRPEEELFGPQEAEDD